MNILLPSLRGEDYDSYAAFICQQYRLKRFSNIEARTRRDTSYQLSGGLDTFLEQYKNTGFLITDHRLNRVAAESLDYQLEGLNRQLDVVLFLDSQTLNINSSEKEIFELLDYYDARQILRRINAIGQRGDICNAIQAELNLISSKQTTETN